MTLYEDLHTGKTTEFTISWAPVDGDFIEFAVCATTQKSITKKNRELWK